MTTYIAVAICVAFLFLMNVPGQLSLEMDLSGQGQFGPVLDGPSVHYEHGWPFTYAKRYAWFSAPSIWRIDQDITDFTPLLLIVDVTIAAVLTLVVGIWIERWRRRSKQIQISLRTAFLLLSVVAIALGYYAMNRKEYQKELRILKQVESTLNQDGNSYTQDVQRNYNSPTWLMHMTGGKFMREFDRVVSIETKGDYLEAVSQLTHLRSVVVWESASSSQLKHLEKLPHLKTLNLTFVNVSDDSDHVVCGEDKYQSFVLPRLPNLRGINLYDTSYCGHGLEHLTSLEVLALHYTNCNDDTLEKIGKLTKLRYLDLTNTKITDDGLRHLKSLDQLEELLLDAQVSDESLKHLSNLRQLKVLMIDLTEVSDAGIPTLSKLKNLEYLDIEHSLITEAGVKELKRLLPNCEIDY